MWSEDGTGYGDGMGSKDGMGYVDGMRFIDCIEFGHGNKISTIFRCPEKCGMKPAYPCSQEGRGKNRKYFRIW